MKFYILIWALVASSVSAYAAHAESYESEVTHGERFDNRHYDRLVQWCQDSVRMLREARERASQSLSMGDYGAAKRQLVRGLETANRGSRVNRAQGPLTGRATFRGVEIARTLEQAMGDSSAADSTIVHFLFGYYEFVFYVADQLDVPYYIPYKRCGDRCENNDNEKYDRALQLFAKEQVNVVLTTLAEPNGRFIYPKGDPTGYLVALEVALGYAACDLRESLRAARYSCSILALESLQQRLAAFNRSSDVYRSEPEAVTSSYYEADDILRDLAAEQACERRWPQYKTSYRPGR